ncbi:MAG: hypothetical protein JRN08_08805 [Nitrososphaerota archaeon]|jgi:hypothetical protein|nr:hypothetical protein [Nitrososphaerota archaeon]
MSGYEVGHDCAEGPETLETLAVEIESEGRAMKEPWDADVTFDWNEESAWLLEMAARIRRLI